MQNSSKKISFSIFSKHRAALSGLAILLIMVFHYFENVVQMGEEHIIYGPALLWCRLIGSIGVELFLLISGIGLYFSFHKNRKLLSFYERRLKRILLPYFLVSVPFFLLRDIFVPVWELKQTLVEMGVRDVSYGKILLESSQGISKGANWVNVLRDIFFVDFWREGDRSLWYIVFVLAMYLIFPIFYYLVEVDASLSKKAHHWYLMPILFTAFFVLAFHFFAGSHPEIWDNTEIAWLRIPVFLFGVYWGRKVFHKENFELGDYLFLAFGFVFYIIEFFRNSVTVPNGDRMVTGLFSMTVLLVLALFCQWVQGAGDKRQGDNAFYSFLLFCGDRSLELYLTHVTIRSLFNAVDFKTCILWHYAICLAISFALSVAIHKLLSTIK
ncbi:MAG: acyltransferase [Lachnospiraceae bacterium]|nr:acyltransferase [Lachnospiraceae bacterium]